jgi:O-antigen/teichoic acid export membrane protein
VRLRQNILYNVVGQGIVLALSLVAVRLIFAHLGGDVFGIIFFVLALSPLCVGALDLGLSATIVREISQNHERDPGYVRDLGRTAATVCWAMYLGVVVLLLAAAPVLVSKWVHLSSLDQDTATMLLRVLGASALTALPRGFYGAILRGLQRMKYSNAIDVSMSALQQGGAAILLLTGAGSFAVFAWLALGFVLGTAAYIAATGVFLGWRTLLPGWSRPVVDRNRGFSARLSAISVMTVISVQLDKVFVSKLLPIVMFGFYSFVASLAFRAVFVSVAIYLAALPALSELLAEGNRPHLARQYRRLQDLQCLLAAPVLALVLYAETPLVSYAFDPGVARAMILPLAVLCMGFFLQMAVATPMAMLIASGAPGLVARASACGLAVGAPIGLAGAIALGMPGAALFFLVYNLALCWYMVSRGASRYLGMAPGDWYLHMGRILVIALVVYAAPLALVLRLGPSTLTLAAVYVVASAVFCTIAFRRLMGSELKGSVIGMSQQLGRGLRRLEA